MRNAQKLRKLFFLRSTILKLQNPKLGSTKEMPGIPSRNICDDELKYLMLKMAERKKTVFFFRSAIFNIKCFNLSSQILRQDRAGISLVLPSFGFCNFKIVDLPK